MDLLLLLPYLPSLLKLGADLCFNFFPIVSCSMSVFSVRGPWCLCHTSRHSWHTPLPGRHSNDFFCTGWWLLFLCSGMLMSFSNCWFSYSCVGSLVLLNCCNHLFSGLCCRLKIIGHWFLQNATGKIACFIKGWHNLEELASTSLPPRPQGPSCCIRRTKLLHWSVVIVVGKEA